MGRLPQAAHEHGRLGLADRRVLGVDADVVVAEPSEHGDGGFRVTGDPAAETRADLASQRAVNEAWAMVTGRSRRATVRRRGQMAASRVDRRTTAGPGSSQDSSRSSSCSTPIRVMVRATSSRKMESTWRHPGRAPRRQAVEIRATDAHRLGSQTQRLDDVAAPADPPVEQDLGLAADPMGDGREGVERGHGAVELATAMVGDHDTGRLPGRRHGRRPRRRAPP